MADARRRRRRREYQRSNRSNLSILAGVIAAGCAAAHVIFMEMASHMGGETPNIMGGAGLLLMIVSIVTLVVGGREFREKHYTMTSRLAGLILPIAAVILWVGTYLLGIAAS